MTTKNLNPISESEYKHAVSEILRPLPPRQVKHENRQPTQAELNRKYKLVKTG